MEQATKRPKGRRKPNDGEIGIRYGNRNYIRTPGQALVAKKGKWHLVACPSRDRDGWNNFKLYLHERKALKNMFGLGFGKGAFAPSRDYGLLNDYYPDVVPWVNEQAKLYADGKLPLRKEEGRLVIYQQGKGWMLYKGKNNG
jgi:hypothetical protein